MITSVAGRDLEDLLKWFLRRGRRSQRAAMNRRSRSGTKREVLAPEAVLSANRAGGIRLARPILPAALRLVDNS
jgi:hypothetical protein